MSKAFAPHLVALALTQILLSPPAGATDPQSDNRSLGQKVKALAPGTPKEEVLSLLGDPKSLDAKGDMEVLVYEGAVPQVQGPANEPPPAGNAKGDLCTVMLERARLKSAFCLSNIFK